MAYHVAPGDNFYAIDDRFFYDIPSPSIHVPHLASFNLSSLNCYRRHGSNVYVGDVLNLSPYTVTSIGSQNGSTQSSDQLSADMCLSQTGLPLQE